MSFSYIDLPLFTFLLLLLQFLRNYYCHFCHRYHYFHITLLLNTLLQILCLSAVVELTTQLLILENILWLPLCRINKFGLNTLPSKAVVSEVKIIVTCRRAPARFVDRSCLSCLILQYVSQVGRIFPCLS